MAGDETTGVCVMRLERGARLRPGRDQARGADRPARRLRRALRRGSPSVGGELLVEALDRRAGGPTRLRRTARRRASPTPRRSSRPSAGSTRGRRAGARGAADPCPDAARRRLRRPRGRESASASATRSRCGGRPGRRASSPRSTAASCSAAARAPCGSDRSSRPAGGGCRPPTSCAATGSPAGRAAAAVSAPTPARRAAFETLRRVFEEDAWADRALRAAAERLGLEGRERAQAQALAYGAVQRRGTSDHFIAALTGRPVERIDPPLLRGAPPRPVRAAVRDRRRRSRGRRSGRGARQGPRRPPPRAPGSSTRSCAARSASGTSSSPASATPIPEAAAVAHSVPLWLAELWWEELGPGGGAVDARRRSTSRPSSRCASNGFRGDRDAALAALAAAGVEAAAADPAPPARARRLDRRHRRRAGQGGGADRGRARRPAVAGFGARRRGAGTGARRARPRPLRRPRDQGGADRRRRSAARARASSPSSATRAGRASCGRCSTGSAPERRPSIEGDATGPPPPGPFDAVLVDPPCSGLGTLASRPDARWRRRPGDIEAMAATAARILERALEAAGAGGRVVYSTCTISRRENEEVAGRGRRPASATSAAEPGLAPLAAAGDRALPSDPQRSRPHRRLLRRRARAVSAARRRVPATATTTIAP